MKNRAFVSLGTNLGNRQEHLNMALDSLSSLGNIENTSSLVESPAWGYEDPRSYLNSVAELKTNLEAEKLMSALLRIEQEGGRERHSSENYEARTIDLDILFFNQEIISQRKLIIPHPRLHLRKFVLVPLSEIAPDFIHPIFNSTIKDLLERCKDQSQVIFYD